MAENKKTLANTLKDLLIHHMVTLLFLVLCLIGFHYSGLSFVFFVNDLISRVARNAFMVLALIIPVLAGMGLNFAIVLGAMAAQAALIVIVHWGMTGISGFLACAVLATPLALFLGYLTGKLLNRTKGQEMITSLILGFFANGLYQLVFLVMVGSVIPMENETLLLSSGVGVRVSIDLKDNLKYAIDNLYKLSFSYTLVVVGVIMIAYTIYKFRKTSSSDTLGAAKQHGSLVLGVVGLGLGIWGIVLINSKTLLNNIKVPIVTMLCILGLCLFNVFITRTKIGQDFRTVGQDQHIATVSGLATNQIRVLAILISTLLAAWGQLFFLQNLGTLSTYGQHEYVGIFAIAALLIGGASVTKATIGQALLGTVLFHTLFIVSPLAGKNLFGDPQLGEYFRAFVAYGVIGVALGMHAWKKLLQSRQKMGWS